MDYPGYKSTALRHPKEPLIILPQRLTEVTAPVFGEDRLREYDHDLTRGPQGEAIGQRIIVHGHVKEDDGRPVPDTLVEIWAWPSKAAISGCERELVTALRSGGIASFGRPDSSRTWPSSSRK